MRQPAPAAAVRRPSLASGADFYEDAKKSDFSMRATLYQALGISREASADEVRAALRAQIRKYYAKTRDGQGNVEEALRFINHASRILSDPELRAQYDHDLAASRGTLDQRIAHVVHTAIARGTEWRAGRAPRSGDSSVDPSRGGPGTPASKLPHHPGLTEHLPSVRQSTAVAAALCVLFGTFVTVAIVLVTPADALQAAKQVLVWLTVLLVAATLVYAVVHGIAWATRRHHGDTVPMIAPADLATLNWRRQKSVFLGTNRPQEDASWVFQLRMAELERAKLGRTSEPHPWNRLAARLFDYALWGLILAIPLSELRSLAILSPEQAYWLAHPLIAPVLITASWIPLEGALIATTNTTPGKWLFGVYLQFSISDAYATRDTWPQLRRATQRAFRVWWQGMGCGVLLLAPVLIAVAYEKLVEYQETAWDFAEDCLVTHGPTGGLNAVTGIAGLAAMLWLYGVAWHAPTAQSLTWARATLIDTFQRPVAMARAAFAPREETAGGAPRAPATETQGSRALELASRAVSMFSAAPPNDAPVTSGAPSTPNPSASSAPIDPEIAALFVERRKRIAQLSADCPRMLEARSFGRAAELCREWADLELGNAKAWRALGRAQDALGNHRVALAAFRRAKQYDPADASIDADINRSQRGIVNEFLARRGR
jgi:hypothetical protein